MPHAPCFGFRTSDLFRISNFGFRICPLLGVCERLRETTFLNNQIRKDLRGEKSSQAENAVRRLSADLAGKNNTLSWLEPVRTLGTQE
jgi:hypothetical protein